ncbi:MAG: hypothetical protein OXE58_09010 [Acidobacteria bacterium]|nr:hypothetical protein [Acidobacteriota bacterium]
MFQELRAHIAYRGLDLDLFAWRTSSGREVDVVACGGDRFHAIEVKRSRSIRSADRRGTAGARAGERPFRRGAATRKHRGAEPEG